MEEQILLRHKGFFSPENQKALSVTVYGAGSVGSHTVYELAKLGVKSLKCIDFDIVELPNIGNQFFKVSDVGKFKVVALRQNIIDFTGNEIEVGHLKVDSNSDLELAEGSIHILTFDNMQARKDVFNLLKDFPVTLIDARAGGQGWEIQEVRMDNEEACEKYAKTLEGEFSEAKCGEKTVIYNVTNLASEICAHFKKMNGDEKRATKIRREMMNYKMLANFKEEESEGTNEEQ